MTNTSHHQLIELGFTHEAMPENWFCGGDAENGPTMEGGPTYDVYENDELALRVFIGEDGVVLVEHRNMYWEITND